MRFLLLLLFFKLKIHLFTYSFVLLKKTNLKMIADGYRNWKWCKAKASSMGCIEFCSTPDLFELIREIKAITCIVEFYF